MSCNETKGFHRKEGKEWKQLPPPPNAAGYMAEAQALHTKPIPKGSPPYDSKMEKYKLIEAVAMKCGWGNLYYDVLTKAIFDRKITSLIEVGIGYGGHAQHLLSHTYLDNYMGVDPHQYSLDPTDAFSRDVAIADPTRSPQDNFDLLHEWIRDVRLQPFANRAQLIRKASAEAAKTFVGTVDCVFIDGDHRYPAVKQDLNAWIPKVKSGGVFCGDDYWMEDVKRAVDEFANQQNKKLEFWTSKAGYRIWFMIK